MCLKEETKKPVSSLLSGMKGSRRKKLWELPQTCHCPVIGVCVPLDTLRKIAHKCLDKKPLPDDYLIHVSAVSWSDRRNALSERIHDELDRRYQLVIRQLRQAAGSEELEHAWNAAVANGDVAGSLWAILTHPRCSPELLERLIHQMHMLQHQAGAEVRVDIARHRDLANRHEQLLKESALDRQKFVTQLTERNHRIEQLEADLMRTRAEAIGKESLILSLKGTLADLHEMMPDVAGIQRIRAELAYLRAKCKALQERESQRSSDDAASPLTSLFESADAETGGSLAHSKTDAQVSAMDTQQFQNQVVLCVGGKSRNVGPFRSIIEQAGGQFSFHDGGFENSLKQLDHTLAAADLVICQTGCISHNAYWRVKEHCKRTGKRCVFVDMPSRTGLAKGLDSLAEDGSPEQDVDAQSLVFNRTGT